MRTYDRETTERYRKFHQTAMGVVYDEQLAGPDGMWFCLIRERHHTDRDIKAAKSYLLCNRDVVGEIEVGIVADETTN